MSFKFKTNNFFNLLISIFSLCRFNWIITIGLFIFFYKTIGKPNYQLLFVQNVFQFYSAVKKNMSKLKVSFLIHLLI